MGKKQKKNKEYEKMGFSTKKIKCKKKIREKNILSIYTVGILYGFEKLETQKL